MRWLVSPLYSNVEPPNVPCLLSTRVMPAERPPRDAAGRIEERSGRGRSAIRVEGDQLEVGADDTSRSLAYGRGRPAPTRRRPRTLRRSPPPGPASAAPSRSAGAWPSADRGRRSCCATTGRRRPAPRSRGRTPSCSPRRRGFVAAARESSCRDHLQRSSRGRDRRAGRGRAILRMSRPRGRAGWPGPKRRRRLLVSSRPSASRARS